MRESEFVTLVCEVGKQTTRDVIEQYGDQARANLSRFFTAGDYPPKELALIAIKDRNILEVWGRGSKAWYFVTEYEIQAASGVLGPKLLEGDRQVPEGIYKILGFNPNSSYHLSMKLNYPNEFDLAQARREGRDQPGSDIFIHGKSVSVGCLAMGDAAIEDLFVLVYDVGMDKVRVIISPSNPRGYKLQPAPGSPAWVGKLYAQIEQQLAGIYPAEK